MEDEVRDGDADFNELMATGVIKSFEFTLELAWNLMKDYAAYQGYMDVKGSRDALRKAFALGLISDKRWMKTIEDRNSTSRDYGEHLSADVFRRILDVYHPLFIAFEKKMKALYDEELRIG